MLKLEEEVFGLQVPVHNQPTLVVVDGSRDLDEDGKSVLLGKIAELQDFVKDVATTADP